LKLRWFDPQTRGGSTLVQADLFTDPADTDHSVGAGVVNASVS
jgi:hypothetical protein